jgi:Fe-S cluster assembly protein SufD
LAKKNDANTATLTAGRIGFRPIVESEPEWLYKLRKQGWEFYHDTPLPPRADHLWRYTDPGIFVMDKPEEQARIVPVQAANPEQDVSPISPDHAAFGHNRSDLLTFAQMNQELADQGVIFTNLNSAAEQNSDLVRENLGALLGPDFGKFEALNMALWNNGLFLYIPDNAVIEKPVYLHRHPTGKYTIQRLLIVAGDNAQATFIDDYSGHCRHEGAIANNAVEILAGDSVNLKYINLQRLAEDNSTYVTIRSRVGRGGNMYSLYGGLGSSTVKVNAGTILNGRGSSSRMAGVLFAHGGQHFDYHTRHHHASGESFSDLDFKVVLKDKATSAYTGLIRIEKDAVSCEAYQENRNLLLNEGTRAESIPELEILTDEVRCTHGATMGPIDPEMLFYLKSRGLSKSEAAKAVVGGFLTSTLKSAPSESGQVIMKSVDEKLKGI